jgi:hypothetical protein
MPEVPSPDHLQTLLAAGGEPGSAAERDAVVFARRLQRMTPRGPSAAEATRLTSRFESFVARGGRPEGFAGLFPAWVTAPAAQRLAAAALFVGSLSAGTTALGYTPVDAARDSANVAAATGELAANIIRNLNPNRGEDGVGAAVDSGTLTPDASGSQTPSAATATLAGDETAVLPTAEATQSPSPGGSATPATPEPSPAAGVQAVSAGEAGSVDIRQSGSFLEVVATDPAPGWNATVVTGSGQEVVVLFTNGPRSVELKVDIEDGRLDPEIEVDDDSGDDSSGDDSDDDNSGSRDDD